MAGVILAFAPNRNRLPEDSPLVSAPGLPRVAIASGNDAGIPCVWPDRDDFLRQAKGVTIKMSATTKAMDHNRGRQTMRSERRTQMGRVLGIVAMLLAVSNTIHAADWLPGYQGTGFRQLLSVTNRAHLSANLTNVPVLVRLTPRNYTDTSVGGSDVRFTAGDGTTLLDFERETHDTAKAIWVYWVRLPAVYAASNTDFYVYYRPATNTDLSSGTNVWASNDYPLLT